MMGFPDRKGKAISPETLVFSTGVARLNPALGWMVDGGWIPIPSQEILLDFILWWK